MCCSKLRDIWQHGSKSTQFYVVFVVAVVVVVFVVVPSSSGTFVFLSSCILSCVNMCCSKLRDIWQHGSNSTQYYVVFVESSASFIGSEVRRSSHCPLDSVRMV